MRGEVVRPPPLVLFEADAIMPYQHRRPGTLTVRARQMGGHSEALYVIGDFTRFDHHQYPSR
jgi:hypothetical protein